MIGAIADDFTGGTDVAVAFQQAGFRTAIVFGDPAASHELPDVDATVVALKTRTVAASEAVRRSLDAARWLQSRGATQLYFKYCSTFDSTAKGNIGPVCDALAHHMQAPVTVVAPSSPVHGRTQYMGRLFVGEQLLSESPMRHHPLTPMNDSRIPAALQLQTPREVGLVAYATVARGHAAVRDALDLLARDGIGYAVTDALSDADLREIGKACVDDVLVTGAAGMARGLGDAWAARLPLAGAGAQDAHHDPVGDSPAAALAGSCSARTLEQIETMQSTHPSFCLDPVATPDAAGLAEQALAWYDSREDERAPLIYASRPPEELIEIQNTLGSARAADILEGAMGLIARGLVARGTRRLVVAGGETSGAVVTALGVYGGVVGEEAAPGVPWIYTTSDQPLALLLKSGNFGEPGLLARAAGVGIKQKADA